jgi:hypothetical protein
MNRAAVDRIGGRPWALLGAVVACALASLVPIEANASSMLVVAAVAVAVAAALTASHRFASFAIPQPMPRPRARGDMTTAASGPATDPLHHPLRPRAPGLV